MTCTTYVNYERQSGHHAEAHYDYYCFNTE